jgi:hypothetical protein
MSISIAHAQSLPVDRSGEPAAPAAQARAFAAAGRFTHWLECLAQWAERQPPHRRLGSYQMRVPPLPKA